MALSGRCTITGVMSSSRGSRPRPPAHGWTGPKKFAEPVSVSSTAFVDLSLAGSALELGFDLLRFRARRKRKASGWTGPLQGRRTTCWPQFAEIQFSTFPQHAVQLVDNPLPHSDAVEFPRVAPSACDFARGLLVHLGPRVRPLHLVGRARSRRERRDRIRLRCRRGLPDLLAGDALRRGRTAPSARAPGPTSALIPGVSEHQETRQLGSELLA